MTTEQLYFIEEAEAARLDYVTAKNELLSYMGSKSIKSMKKDSRFIDLFKKVESLKTLWYDYNRAALLSK